MAITKSGASIVYYNPKVGDAITSGNLAALSWYMIATIASSSSALPPGLKKGSISKQRRGQRQIQHLRWALATVCAR